MEEFTMKLSFRWYGKDDPVRIDYIKQIPNMHSIVTAIYDTPVGEVWSQESIDSLKDEVEEQALSSRLLKAFLYTKILSLACLLDRPI